MASLFSPHPHFDFADADIAILSGEGDPTKFCLHRCILMAASPFFKDMFSLPQSTLLQRKDVPEVPVSEHANTLALLFQFLYPFKNPEIETLDDLVLVLDAALKYDFTAVIENLKTLLISPCFLEFFPLRVYAIACRYEFEEEARVASRYTLHENILDGQLSDDLKYITAYSYHRLLELHRHRARDAQDLLRPNQNLKCLQCNSSGHGSFGYPKWWHEFEAKAKMELAIRPTTDIIFNINFLAQASVAGCPRCPASLLESAGFLTELKQKIDALPSTI